MNFLAWWRSDFSLPFACSINFSCINIPSWHCSRIWILCASAAERWWRRGILLFLCNSTCCSPPAALPSSYSSEHITAQYTTTVRTVVRAPMWALCDTPMPPVKSTKKNSKQKKPSRLKKRKEEEENLKWSGPLRSPETHVCWPVDNPTVKLFLPWLSSPLIIRFDSDHESNQHINNTWPVLDPGVNFLQ
jgi:hypothetical protein